MPPNQESPFHTRFELQPITMLDTQDHRHTVDALVALQEDGTPIGLAAHPVHRFDADTPVLVAAQYTITHLLSGLRVYREPVATEGIACTWLERIAPLTDWTHPALHLRPQSTLRLLVMLARVQAMEGCDEDHLEAIPPIVPNRTPAQPLTLESLTALIEWMIYAMEYLALPREAVPALEQQLALHAALVRASEGTVQEQAVVS